MTDLIHLEHRAPIAAWELCIVKPPGFSVAMSLTANSHFRNGRSFRPKPPGIYLFFWVKKWCKSGQMVRNMLDDRSMDCHQVLASALWQKQSLNIGPYITSIGQVVCCT